MSAAINCSVITIGQVITYEKCNKTKSFFLSLSYYVQKSADLVCFERALW